MAETLSDGDRMTRVAPTGLISVPFFRTLPAVNIQSKRKALGQVKLSKVFPQTGYTVTNSMDTRRYSQNVMEPEVLLPCSKEPATGPYPETDKYSPYPQF
jgi:hypothetical protein